MTAGIVPGRPRDPARATTAAADAPRPPAPPVQTLRRRADFLRAAKARRQAMAGFTLQARRRDAAEGVDPAAVRIGFTCSKKLGNAVARNRAKRRLRAIARAVLPGAGRAGWDYVLIGRPETTATRAFADLQADLAAALARIHGGAEARE